MNAPTTSQPGNNQAGKPQRRWYKADLHLHTPASRDYEEPKITHLDWLKQAVSQGVEIVAITDHNTVAGVAAVRQELEWLTRLEQQGRLTEDERTRLQEWRAVGQKVLILPGFEFTATFGFHILGIFSPETSVRTLEHLLLTLKVPPEKLDIGSTETGATADVLTAYRVIQEAGGIVIAAHANSTHGVAMRNFPFGGQTKIAYTQDSNLDALEVTDLENHRQSTARFFNGSKSEYARRMHCIQGSDSHRLVADPKNIKRLGIGERATEFMLDAPSFENLKALLQSSQWDRTRPARPADKPYDPLATAREEGEGLLISFHESASQRGGKLPAILNDICAFANTAGGTIFVGASQRKEKPKGLPDAKAVENEIRVALQERFTPQLEIKIDVLPNDEVQVLRVRVPKGNDRPYCLDGNKFYLRDEDESNQAVRDEIIALVREALIESGKLTTARDGASERPAERESNRSGNRPAPGRPGQQQRPGSNQSNGRANTPASSNADGAEQTGVSIHEVLENAADGPEVGVPEAADRDAFYLPQVGVEIVATELRNGNQFHAVRDLRSGQVIHNVTRKGARKLWHYAISQHEDHPVDSTKVQWQGNVGLIHLEKRAGKPRYDLALREGERTRVFYGVTDDGMEGAWGEFAQDEE